MEWQATDQFGNLFVAESSAESVQDLRPHLAALIDEARGRAGDSFQVTVDLGYGEVNAPDPESVSHVLRVPWLAGQDPSTGGEAVCGALREIAGERGLASVTVRLA